MKAIALFLLLASSTFALNDNKSELCRLELEGVLQSPESRAKDFLAAVDRRLRVMGDVLFTPFGQSVIDSIEKAFKVRVEVQRPFAVQCDSYSNTEGRVIAPGTGPVFIPFGNEAGPDGIIQSIKVSVDMDRADMDLQMMRLSFGMALSSPNVLLYPGGTCSGNPGFQGTFEDGGLDLLANCANLKDGLTFAAGSGESLVGAAHANAARANTPMYFVTRILGGEVSAQFRSATLTLCYYPSRTIAYDVLRSNLNVPGFRLGNDNNYHYTSIYYNTAGEMLHVTITAPSYIDMCKK